MSKIAFLFESTSLHGFRHLVYHHQGWKKAFSRIFWACFIGISFILMIRMLRSTINKGLKSTSINVDTTYRNWDNSFPAVSICSTKGKSTALIKESIGSTLVRENNEIMKLAMRHYRAIQSVLFVDYQDPTEGIPMETCLEMNASCGIDFHYQRKKLLPQYCHQIIAKVFYRGVEINCSDIFIPTETEFGTCFVANSLYGKRSKGKENLENFNNLPLRYSNNDFKERTLTFYYNGSDFQNYKLFIHTPEELPNGKLESIGLRQFGGLTTINVKTAEFLNQDDVKYESMDARECRFPFEKFETLNLPYSLNYCRYLKRIERELSACNCTFPLGLARNHTLKECNVAEFPCLHNVNVNMSNEMKTKEGIMKNIGECLVPSCISMEIIKVGEFETDFELEKLGAVKIEVVNMPTLRYIRRVTFTQLDMMVNVGGIIGLFFGASVLSILELGYLVFQMFRVKDPKK